MLIVVNSTKIYYQLPCDTTKMQLPIRNLILNLRHNKYTLLNQHIGMRCTTIYYLRAETTDTY